MYKETTMSQDKWNESTTDDDQPIVEWFECIYAKLREITGINDGPTIECVDDYQNLLDLIWTTFSNGDPTFMIGMTHSWFDRWLWTPLYDHERDQPYPNLIAIYVRCTRTHQWFRLLLEIGRAHV